MMFYIKHSYETLYNSKTISENMNQISLGSEVETRREGGGEGRRCHWVSGLRAHGHEGRSVRIAAAQADTASYSLGQLTGK